jgi:hypothetical protein
VQELIISLQRYLSHSKHFVISPDAAEIMCEDFISHAEKIQPAKETAEKSQLHEMLFVNFGEHYLKALQPFQKRIVLLDALEKYFEEWDAVFIKELNAFKKSNASITSICSRLILWMENATSTQIFHLDLDADEKAEESLDTLLSKLVSDEYQKAKKLRVAEQKGSSFTSLYQQPSSEFNSGDLLKEMASSKPSVITLKVTPDFERAKPNLAVF